MKTDKWLVHDAHMKYKLKIRGLTVQHRVKQDSSVYPALLLLNHFIFELLCAKLRGGHTELLRKLRALLQCVRAFCRVHKLL